MSLFSQYPLQLYQKIKAVNLEYVLEHFHISLHPDLREATFSTPNLTRDHISSLLEYLERHSRPQLIQTFYQTPMYRVFLSSESETYQTY